MEEIVVDASVIVKWFVVEQLREKALGIRDDFIEGRIRLNAPALMLFEVLNATKHGHRDIDSRALGEISESLGLYGIKLYNLEGEYAKETVQAALDNSLTIYDASYIALAKYLQTTVYTSDSNLIRSVRDNYRIYVRSLEDYK